MNLLITLLQLSFISVNNDNWFIKILFVEMRQRENIFSSTLQGKNIINTNLHEFKYFYLSFKAFFLCLWLNKQVSCEEILTIPPSLM